MYSIKTERLTSTQVADYKREGYLIMLEPLFPEAKFTKLKNHFEDKLARLEDGHRPEAMDVPHFADPALFEWLFADEVLDLVEPLIGPDIALWASHFICKPRGDGKRVPWHEDSFYWKGLLDPMEVVTVWVAIDPSTKQNGCMCVIPNTHGNGYSEYEPVDATKNVFSIEIKKAMRDEDRSVAIELEPNHCSLHDGKLIHGSAPNNSSIRRCGYTMRYMPAHVKHNCDKNTQHNLYLARGRDKAGNSYGDPTKAYPELARFREKNRHGH